MADFKLSTVFTGLDKFSPTLKAMGANVNSFSSKARRDLNKLNPTMRGIGNQIKNVFGALGLIGGAAAVGMAIKDVTEKFIIFDDAITKAGAKFATPIKRGTKEFELLSQAAIKAGGATEFGASEAAKGLDIMAGAGFSAEQAMSALPGLLNLTTISTLGLEKTTNIMTDSLGAFNLKAQDTVQLQKNLSHMNDVFVKTTTMANLSVENLFDSIKKGAVMFTQSGQTMETFSTLIGILAEKNIKGSEAGNTLKSIMMALTKPTGEAAKTLSNLGIKTADSSGNFRDIVDIMADFEKATKTMSEVQKNSILKTIFGNKTMAGFGVLLQSGSKNLKLFRDDLLNSNGAADSMANILRSSIGTQLKMLQSAFEGVGFAILGAFSVDGVSAIQSLTETLNNLDVSFIINGLKGIGFIINWLIIKPIQGLIWLLDKLFQAIFKIVEMGAKFGEFGFSGIFEQIKKNGIFGGLSKVFWNNEETAPEGNAPNRSALEAQKINFEGLLNIAGAPKGSTIQDNSKGSPPFRMEFLGQQ